MHEMSICQGLISQVEKIAREKGARQVHSIFLSIGPLSGVEPELLRRAFEVAQVETVARNAKLEMETGSIVVECRSCGARTSRSTTTHARGAGLEPGTTRARRRGRRVRIGTGQLRRGAPSASRTSPSRRRRCTRAHCSQPAGRRAPCHRRRRAPCHRRRPNPPRTAAPRRD